MLWGFRESKTFWEYTDVADIVFYWLTLCCPAPRPLRWIEVCFTSLFSEPFCHHTHTLLPMEACGFCLYTCLYTLLGLCYLDTKLTFPLVCYPSARVSKINTKETFNTLIYIIIRFSETFEFLPMALLPFWYAIPFPFERKKKTTTLEWLLLVQG